MYCINCGKEIPDNAVFCPECGAKQEIKTVVEELLQTEPKKVEKSNGPLFGGKILMIAGIAFGVLALFSFIVMFAAEYYYYLCYVLAFGALSAFCFLKKDLGIAISICELATIYFVELFVLSFSVFWTIVKISAIVSIAVYYFVLRDKKIPKWMVFLPAGVTLLSSFYDIYIFIVWFDGFYSLLQILGILLLPIPLFLVTVHFFGIGNVERVITETKDEMATDSASLDQLKDLNDLLEAGILTQEEFDIKKKDILHL